MKTSSQAIIREKTSPTHYQRSLFIYCENVADALVASDSLPNPVIESGQINISSSKMIAEDSLTLKSSRVQLFNNFYCSQIMINSCQRAWEVTTLVFQITHTKDHQVKRQYLWKLQQMIQFSLRFFVIIYCYYIITFLYYSLLLLFLQVLKNDNENEQV